MNAIHTLPTPLAPAELYENNLLVHHRDFLTKTQKSRHLDYLMPKKYNLSTVTWSHIHSIPMLKRCPKCVLALIDVEAKQESPTASGNNFSLVFFNLDQYPHVFIFLYFVFHDIDLLKEPRLILILNFPLSVPVWLFPHSKWCCLFNIASYPEADKTSLSHYTLCIITWLRC